MIKKKLKQGIKALLLYSVIGCAYQDGHENKSMDSEDIGVVQTIETISKKHDICKEMREDTIYNNAVDDYFDAWRIKHNLDNQDWNILPEDWPSWMKDDDTSNETDKETSNHDRFCRTFYLTRALKKKIRIVVDMYDDKDPAKVYSDPSWAGSEEHLSLLEQLFELTYPGWDITLKSLIGMNEESKKELASKRNQVHLFLGYREGNSHSSGSSILVHYEIVAGHELGHVLGLSHHYPNIEYAGQGFFYGPGETRCLMDRNWNQYGSPERFALGLDMDVDNEENILEISNKLGSHYLQNY